MSKDNFLGVLDSTKPKLEEEEAGENYRSKNGMKSSDFAINQILEYFGLFLPGDKKRQENEQMIWPLHRAAGRHSYRHGTKDASEGSKGA